jgi:hypothetical protein
LRQTLARKEEDTEQKAGDYRALKSEYETLLTVHVLSAEDGGDVKHVRKKLKGLVHEIDDCINEITLLNG